MLSRLKISNFALVDDIDLTFEKGMTVLTGETGAGKSVIVAALGLVLGDRADREHIRHGATQAAVEATFWVDHTSPQYKEAFADYIESDEFTISRQVSRDGTSKIKVNGAVTTMARLKELTSPLAEILGQHANQMLLDEDNHLFFLDSFASLDTAREEVGVLFGVWEKAYGELRRMRTRRDDLANERELLLFQEDEITKAQIRVGEEEELNRQRKILDSSRTLMESAAILGDVIDGEEHSALQLVRLAKKELDRMAELDPALRKQVEQMSEIDYQLEDLRRSIEQYGSSVPDDPQQLAEINERLDEIFRIKRKYGNTEEAVLATLALIREKLETRPDIDAHLRYLEAEEQRCRQAYAEKALALSEVRQKASQYLEKLVVKELADLAIEDAEFACELIYKDNPEGVTMNERTVEPTAHGLESVRFLFSANPGEPLKSLVKTASGGEISRVLLALKAAEKKSNNKLRSLLVFDEVDAGIGGRTGNKLAEKLHRLSEDSQILVITHLHQIARVADHHFLAEKTSGHGKRITINVTKLDGSGVINELSRMMALPEEEAFPHARSSKSKLIRS
jgi:DNA repair protein RecN (Recombination protein N)